MRKAVFSLALLAIACVLPARPTQAQTRVFVGAQGSDSNPCSFAAPCRTFQHAHDVVAANGEIDVLDPAGYGAITITKAISIQGHGYAGISVGSSGTGILVNLAVSGAVNLNGLLLDGSHFGEAGIVLGSAANLFINDCMVRNFQFGIALAPTGDSNIAVSNTIVSANLQDGIYLQPTGGTNAQAVFNRVESNGNGRYGISVAGNQTTGQVVATIVDSLANLNGSNGIYALGRNSLNTIVFVHRSTAHSAGVGIQTDIFADDFSTMMISESNFFVANKSTNAFSCQRFGNNSGVSSNCQLTNQL